MPRRSFVDRTRRLRKESRTIPIPGHRDFGDGEDADKYWRCWNCGFVCDVTRDSLGGPQDKDGVSQKEYDASYSTDQDTLLRDAAEHGYVGTSTQPLLTLLSLRVDAVAHVILENDADGSPKTIRTNWEPDVSSGCPFCGTRNWRGDF